MSLAILCPGQGSQDTASFLALAGDPRAREVVDAFEQATEMRVGDLAGLPDAALRANALAQPLVCATALAAHAVLRDRLPEPAVFAGYSVGELAAYGCAGWLSPSEAVRLAVLRAAAMDAASTAPAAMVAVRGLTHEALKEALSGLDVFVAIVNGADRFVVAGLKRDMPDAVARFEAKGAGVTPLGVRVASHTPLLSSVVGRFREALEASGLRPAAPVIAGVDGTPVLARARAIETLSSQVASTVRWFDCISGLKEQGVTIAIELPPGADLSRLVREAEPVITARSVAEFRSADGLVRWVERQPT